MKRTSAALRTVHENIYGNWYGYEGSRRVEMFFGDNFTQGRRAHEWARDGSHNWQHVHRRNDDGIACVECARLRNVR